MRALPRCYVPAAGIGTTVTLASDEADHLMRVLRAAPGDGVSLFDGKGGEWVGRVRTAGHRVTVDVVDTATPVAEPPVCLTLGIGRLKGAQMDVVVRDATMLGAWAIVPLSTDHVSVPIKGRGTPDAVARWQRVALASARQCRRAVVPTVAPVTPFREALERTGTEMTVMCVEPGRAGSPVSDGTARAQGAGAPLARWRERPPSSALLLVGPEGGWSEQEVRQARTAGAAFLELGPRTLRAETAPTVALSCLWTLWGW